MSGSFEENLINAVRLRTFLYDKCHPDHSKRNKLNYAWAEIAAEIGKPAIACKTRWRSLKDRFYCLLKEDKQDELNVKDEMKTICWPFYQQLQFLAELNESAERTDHHLVGNKPGQSNSTLLPSTMVEIVLDDNKIVEAINHSQDSSLMSPSSCSSNSATSSSTRILRRTNRKRTKSQPAKNSLVKLSQQMESRAKTDNHSVQRLGVQEDSNRAFAKYITAELRKFSDEDQDDIKFEILELFYRKKKKVVGCKT